MVKAPYRVPIGHAPLGGSGGIPPQNFFEIWMLKGAIWCSLYFICTSLFTIIFNKITKRASDTVNIQVLL